jgi:hypothetical protein
VRRPVVGVTASLQEMTSDGWTELTAGTPATYPAWSDRPARTWAELGLIWRPKSAQASPRLAAPYYSGVTYAPLIPPSTMNADAVT